MALGNRLAGAGEADNHQEVEEENHQAVEAENHQAVEADGYPGVAVGRS